MTYFFLFLLGLAFGSFINCLVYRLNRNLSFGGRSFCDHCKKQLKWHDNLPIVSFLFLKGRCRFCRSPIPWQYPLVELATGLLTVFLIKFGISNLVIGYLLMAIFVSDLNYQTIPDHFIYPAIFLSLFINHNSLFVFSGLIAALFFLILHWFTHGRGMALGDVKLAGLMGLFLGWPEILAALYLAFLTGAFWGVILILLKKKKFGQQIAFGPFLVAGTLVALFWGEKIWLRIIRLLLW